MRGIRAGPPDGFSPSPRNDARLPTFLAKRGELPRRFRLPDPGPSRRRLAYFGAALRFGRTVRYCLPTWQGCEASLPCGRTPFLASATCSRHPPPSHRTLPSLNTRLPRAPSRQSRLTPVDQTLSYGSVSKVGSWRL